MDIQSYRAFDASATTPLMPAQAGSQTLAGLDQFLGYVESRLHCPVEDLVETMLRHLTARASGTASADPRVVLQLAASRAFAVRFPALFVAQLNLIGELLDLEQDVWECEEGMDVLGMAFTSAQYVPRYLWLVALIDLIGEAEGTDMMKEFLDWSIAQRPVATRGPKTIAELRERDIPWNVDDKGQDAISALVSEHQLMKKVTACRTHQALTSFDDGGRMEVIACYPDHASIKRSNPYFALTRTQTLFTGAYCDTCFHDVRYVSEFAHPTAAVFDELSYE